MNVYCFDDKEFNSIKALSKYCGVHEKTITARLRKGMTVEQACEKTDRRCTYYNDGTIDKSVSQICREQSKNEELVRNRLARGYTLDEALNKPKKIHKQGNPIVVNGFLYSSIAEALRKYILESKESAIRRKLNDGVNPSTVFNSYLEE